MMIGNAFAADSRELQPSLEMLEFLLEFDTGDGQWVDPAEIDPDVWQVNEPASEPEPVPVSETLQGSES